MTSRGSLHEHWTDGKSAVVVTAESTVISRLVSELGLSGGSPVNLSGDQHALALWGEELTTYLEWRSRRNGSSNGARKVG